MEYKQVGSKIDFAAEMRRRVQIREKRMCMGDDSLYIGFEDPDSPPPIKREITRPQQTGGMNLLDLLMGGYGM